MRERMTSRVRRAVRPANRLDLGQHPWARGYFCASVGTVDEKTIREYIENQRWDDDAEKVKITSRREP